MFDFQKFKMTIIEKCIAKSFNIQQLTIDEGMMLSGIGADDIMNFIKFSIQFLSVMLAIFTTHSVYMSLYIACNAANEIA